LILERVFETTKRKTWRVKMEVERGSWERQIPLACLNHEDHPCSGVTCMSVVDNSREKSGREEKACQKREERKGR
jgi:hypothetical protein